MASFQTIFLDKVICQKASSSEQAKNMIA